VENSGKRVNSVKAGENRFFSRKRAEEKARYKIGKGYMNPVRNSGRVPLEVRYACASADARGVLLLTGHAKRQYV